MVTNCNQKYVDIVPIAGLCNRMRTISSGVYIAKKLDRISNIYWEKNSDCFANFTDLFLPISDPSVTIRNLRFFDILKKHASRKNLLIPKYVREICKIQSIENFNKRDGDIFRFIDNKRNLYLSSCHSMSLHYPLKNLFIPAHNIQREIGMITDKFNDQTYGIHIRRTDNMNSINNSPLSSFYNVIDELLERNCTTKFYVASDSLKVKEDILSRYSNQSIIFHNASLTRNSIKGIQDAVIDLWCLSKTNKIFGSFYSSYSELASELENIPLKIVL
jgi:hypothetical protein